MLTPRFGAGWRRDRQRRCQQPRDRRVGRYAFPTLLSIGVIDSATRMGFLTFLPFILTAKGASLPAIGIALTLVFAGGAAGKLVCAFIGARIGVISTVFLTEILTLVLILAILPLPLEAAIVMLPLLGIALNGTSSVLYGSVPELVAPERRTRAFGIFYTGTIGAGAIAPILYGFVGDAFGLDIGGIVVVAAIVACRDSTGAILRLRCSRARPSISTPVANHRLNQRQRRDRRGIGAQDARAEREPHDVGLPQQQRALVFRKAAFRPDQHRAKAASPLRSVRQGRDRIARVGILVAKDQTRAPDRAPSSGLRSGAGSTMSGMVRMPHCSAASIAFARMRSRLTRVTWVWRVVTGCNRETPSSTAFCTM